MKFARYKLFAPKRAKERRCQVQNSHLICVADVFEFLLRTGLLIHVRVKLKARE